MKSIWKSSVLGFLSIWTFFLSTASAGAEPRFEENFRDQRGEIKIRLETVDLEKCQPLKETALCSLYPAAKKLTSQLSIKDGKRNIFIPIDVLRALYDPLNVSVRRSVGSEFVVLIRGGDTSASYLAKIYVGDGRVQQMEIFETGAEHPVVRSKYFRVVVP